MTIATPARIIERRSERTTPVLDAGRRLEQLIGNTPLLSFRRITEHLPDNVAVFIGEQLLSAVETARETKGVGILVALAFAFYGGSNGGLLVGAALTQRPDLCRAVFCAVPLLDMLRYHHFSVAKLWIPEYGSADDPEAFRWLHAYSPYHHVVPGTRYPAVLLTTAEQDSRVDPLHARKMTALLQWATSANGERPILLRAEAAAGHGVGKPITKRAAESADLGCFLAAQLGNNLT